MKDRDDSDSNLRRSTHSWLSLCITPNAKHTAYRTSPVRHAGHSTRSAFPYHIISRTASKFTTSAAQHSAARNFSRTGFVCALDATTSAMRSREKAESHVSGSRYARTSLILRSTTRVPGSTWKGRWGFTEMVSLKRDSMEWLRIAC